METNDFTIKDIKPGMVLKMKIGELAIISIFFGLKRVISLQDGRWIADLEKDYNGFNAENNDDFDIMEVYKDCSLQEVLWKRKETIEPEEICKQLIEKYGDKQIVVAIEELSELIKELCKTVRVEENKANIIEEIADVLIMTKQMELLFEISREEVHEMVLKKLARTKERLLDKK